MANADVLKIDCRSRTFWKVLVKNLELADLSLEYIMLVLNFVVCIQKYLECPSVGIYVLVLSVVFSGACIRSLVVMLVFSQVVVFIVSSCAHSYSLKC